MIENMPYRAKRSNSNEWIYGYYAAKKSTTYCFESDYHKFPVETEHYIIQERMTDWCLPNEFRLYRVNGDTVCRNTGCIDSGNNPIFDGDIVRITFKYYDTSGNLKHEDTMDRYIKYSKGAFLVYGGTYNFTLYEYFRKYDCIHVIDNIYDNPELLEKLYEENL